MIKFNVKFEPEIEPIVKGIGEALLQTQEIPKALWFEIEKMVLEWQGEYWDAVAQIPLLKSTKAKKKRAVEKGAKIRVGKSSRTEIAKYIEEAGHFTGFVRDRLSSQDRIRGYNVYRFDRAGVTKRGRYQFGINPEFFRDDYPIHLAKWIAKKLSNNKKIFEAMIKVDNKRSVDITLFLWDRIWERVEERLREI